jgi:Zn-dependent protease
MRFIWYSTVTSYNLKATGYQCGIMFHMNELIGISQGIFPFLIIIFSIILHEVAHGYAAFVQGDGTAHRAGRLTLNPLPHIDMVGSVIIPFVAFLTAGTFFGWAKPVPYNPYNIRTRLGLAFVASAGILTNLLLALCAGIAFKMLFMQGILTESLGKAIFTIISVNVSLAFFNLIPIPPFDGMGILEAFFPKIQIKHLFINNPLYMIGAIFAASVLYGMFIPYVFAFIESVLL